MNHRLSVDMPSMQSIEIYCNMLQFIGVCSGTLLAAGKTFDEKATQIPDIQRICESAAAAIFGPFSMRNKYNYKMNRIPIYLNFYIYK